MFSVCEETVKINHILCRDKHNENLNFILKLRSNSDFKSCNPKIKNKKEQ